MGQPGRKQGTPADRWHTAREAGAGRAEVEIEPGLAVGGGLKQEPVEVSLIGVLTGGAIDTGPRKITELKDRTIGPFANLRMAIGKGNTAGTTVIRGRNIGPSGSRGRAGGGRGHFEEEPVIDAIGALVNEDP